MADSARPLLIVEGDPAGICDPETGVCALPDPAVDLAGPAGDAVKVAE
jgi:hypothetical protein